MSAAISSETVPFDVGDQIVELWDRNRLQCGWFLRSDFVPRTRSDFRRCLELLTKHGDRATYVLSRKLLKCL